jgi:DNA ligase-1
MKKNKLYKIDSKGRKRIWFLEINENGQYRSVFGIVGGKVTVSEWTQAKPKNIGKSNQTNACQQSLIEAESKYNLKRDKGWSEVIENQKTFRPMLAKTLPIDDEEKLTKWSDKYAGLNKYIQRKLDGLRCNIFSDLGSLSREGRSFLTLGHIENQLKGFHVEFPNVVLDGEIYNHQYKDDFNSIVSLTKKKSPSEYDLMKASQLLEFHIYDFYDKDNPDLSFSQRFEKFSPFINGKNLKVVDTQIVFMRDIYDYLHHHVNQGYEGSMLRLDLPYENKKSSTLWKLKKFYEDEFELVSINEGKGNWKGMAKTIDFKVNDSGLISGAGVSGSMDYCSYLLENSEEYIGGQVTIKYYGFTPDGKPKFAIAKIFHKGKRDY